MTERERRFVECYMGEAAGNGTKAALLAGYSPVTARNQASRLLTKGYIQSAIEERSQRDVLTWSREQRQVFWTQIAADETVPIPYRLKASELLARSQGDFVERRLLRMEGDAVSLAELIAGAAPTSPQPAPAWTRESIANPRHRAVTSPAPSVRALPQRDPAGGSIPTAAPPVGAPDNGRQRWGAQPASDGTAGSVDIRWDPFNTS